MLIIHRYGRQTFKMAPKDSCLLAFTSFCNPSPWAQAGPSDKQNTVKAMGSHFHDRLQNIMTSILLVDILSVAFLACTLWWSKMLCSRSPCNKELRADSGQQAAMNRDLQSNRPWGTKSCQQPRKWHWRWLLS